MVVVQASAVNAGRRAARDRDSDDEDDVPVRTPGGRRLRKPAQNAAMRVLNAGLNFIGTNAVQTILYIIFVGVFQMLTQSLRMKEEFFFDKMVHETFISNHFDSSHNTFETMRRVADVYEWGNTVLIPGLLGNAGPCDSFVGMAEPASPSNLTEWLRSIERKTKSCNDDVWPDGEGPFHLSGASAPTVPELVARMDVMDWSEGILIRQTRIAPVAAAVCGTRPLSSACLPEVSASAPASRETFVGRVWPTANLTDGAPYRHLPWRYMGHEEIGANPDGIASANLASYRSFESGGYVSVIIPFFSDVYLPEQQGEAHEVDDFREHALNHTNGRAARYFCVRLSWNGEHIRQLCDPNEPASGRTTGVVRAAIEVFWNDLKRAHFIDERTRALTLTAGLRSNHMGVRSRLTLMVETSSLGIVLPSYDMETRVEESSAIASTKLYVGVALCMCASFVLLELLEVAESGPIAYFSDLWNLMDFLNYLVFTFVYLELSRLFSLEGDRTCSSLCQTVGYYDDWAVMGSVRSAKFYLSLCVCIQLLKIIKFANALVPKIGLATAVLSRALVDLLFFGFVFGLSLFAFAQLFFVQLGPVMEGYNDQMSSFISLARALFGDFDIDEILNNSSGYANAVLFLVYLFVAVFILLSMFLAILGEHQAMVRQEADQRRDGPEYGVLTHAWAGVRRGASSLRHVVQRCTHSRAKADALAAEAAEAEAEAAAATAAAADGRARRPESLRAEVRALSKEVHRMTKHLASAGGAAPDSSELAASVAAALQATVRQCVDDRLGVLGGRPPLAPRASARLNGAPAAEATKGQPPSVRLSHLKGNHKDLSLRLGPRARSASFDAGNAKALDAGERRHGSARHRPPSSQLELAELGRPAMVMKGDGGPPTASPSSESSTPSSQEPPSLSSPQPAPAPPGGSRDAGVLAAWSRQHEVPGQPRGRRILDSAAGAGSSSPVLGLAKRLAQRGRPRQQAAGLLPSMLASGHRPGRQRGVAAPAGPASLAQPFAPMAAPPPPRTFGASHRRDDEEAEEDDVSLRVAPSVLRAAGSWANRARRRVPVVTPPPPRRAPLELDSGTDDSVSC